jgi:hypothetical protein
MIRSKTAVGAIALVLAGAGVAGADVPSYDAGTNPSGASQQMNLWCQPDPQIGKSPCNFSPPPTTTDALGPARALSDQIINCNQENENTLDGLGLQALDSEAETTFTDMRGEATKLDQSLEISVKVGILKTSLEASTSQYERITSGMEVSQNVPVPPGRWGYLAALWPTVTAKGTITDGIHFAVTSMELTYPGYGGGDLKTIEVRPYGDSLTDAQKMACSKLPPIVTTGGAATGGAAAQRALGISVCVAGARRCARRSLDLTNASRLLAGRASVALDRGSRVYAIGTDRNGAVKLRAARRLRPGEYTMFVNRPGRETMASCVLH